MLRRHDSRYLFEAFDDLMEAGLLMLRRDETRYLFEAFERLMEAGA